MSSVSRGGHLRRAWSVVVLGALVAASVAIASAPADEVVAAAEYLSLDAPVRLVDTRPGGVTDDGLYAGIEVRAAGSTLEVEVAGRSGVPVDAPVVVLTVTAVDSLDVGYLTVHPTGTARPNTSNVNYYDQHNTASLVVARVGTGGKVSIYTSAATQLVVDVSGYFPSGSYAPLPAPLRLADTRPGGMTGDGLFAGIGLRPAGSTLELQVAGRAGVPVDASTAVLTVTAVDPVAVGFLTVHPTGTTRPNASNVNFYAAHSMANTVVTKIGDDGNVSIFASAVTQLVVDVSGYLPLASYTPLAAPTRLADTRPTGTTIDGEYAGRGGVVGGYSLQLDVAGRAGVPADVSMAVLTVTAVDSSATGYLTVHPTSTARPNASNVNYYADHNTANTVISRIGAGGDVCLFASATTHLVVDVSGYLTGPAPPPAGPECPGRVPRFGPPTPIDSPLDTLNTVSAASTSAIVTAEIETYHGATNIWLSPDGATWSQVAAIDGVGLHAVIGDGAGFVAVGGDEPSIPGPFADPVAPVAYSSPDGSTWVAAGVDNGPYPLGRLDDVASTGTGFVAAGTAWDGAGIPRPAVWTSPDGLGWTIAPGDPLGAVGDEFVMLVAHGAGGYVAVGWTVLTATPWNPGPLVGWRSVDGIDWQRTNMPHFVGRHAVVDLVALGSEFVLLGSHHTSSSIRAVVWNSSGLAWSYPNWLPSNYAIGEQRALDLDVAAGMVLASGSDRDWGNASNPDEPTIWVSSDARTWSQLAAGVFDGPAILDNTFVSVVIRFQGDWVALGTTAPIHPPDPVNLAWLAA